MTALLVVVALFGALAYLRLYAPQRVPFRSDPSAICSETLTAWARSQKLAADPDVSVKIPISLVPTEIAQLGSTNAMSVRILPQTKPEAYVVISFGGAFHSWGMIIGSTNLSSGDAPRGYAEIIKPGYLIYNTYQ